MATEDKFIVAIELGSSKVTGIAGRKQPDGALQVLAFAQEPSGAFIRKGRINNIIKMKACVKSIKEKLEKTLKKNIDKAYIGIGGMGMHTVANSVRKEFGEKRVVTREIVEEIQDENQNSQPADRDILAAIAQEYKLGAQTQPDDPVGIQAESIEGRFLNVVVKKEVKDNIVECLEDEAGIEIAGLPITTLALADGMVPELERHSGCVFVDMGSETTSVAVYKNNLLRHLAVIPLGGRNITRDITSLSIEENEAERLKLEYGQACYDFSEEHAEPIAIVGGRTIAFEEFAGLVEARQEEIVKNIKRQIELSKYDVKQLLGGIILTGGAANMPGMEKTIKKNLGFDKIQLVKNIQTPIRPTSQQHINDDGSANAALAILEKGEINCSGGELESEEGGIFNPGGGKTAKEKAEEARRAAKAEKDKADLRQFKDVLAEKLEGAENAEAMRAVIKGLRETLAGDDSELDNAKAESLAKAEEEAAKRQRAEEKERKRRWWRNVRDKVTKIANDMVSEEKGN